MTETRWTPGPWPVEPTGDRKRIIVGKGLVDGPDGYEVAEVYSDDCDWEEAIANAHLIAAAPELYEALEEFEYLIGGETDAVKKRLSDARTKARAALRKARGEA